MSFLARRFFGKAEPEPAKPKEAPKSQKSTTIRALPASWYLSQEIFDLEKRAIFTKRWLLTTHEYRLPNNGDWQKYQMIDHHFVVCRDHNGDIKAFHTEEGIENFDINQHGLAPIHVHIDMRGLIWTNLDTSDNPVAWSDHFGGSDTQERLDLYNWDEYDYNHTWEMEGTYNWKLLGDNYNECYHCRVAHPDLNNLANINTYRVVPEKSYLMHFGSPTPDMIARGYLISPTYFFPNASVNISRHFFMMQRFIPLSTERSIMRYEVYKNRNSSDEEFTGISDMYKRVMSEDKYLALGAQENMKRGVFINGEMHADWEKGSLWFQQLVRELVKEHSKQEAQAGHEIWPLEETTTRSPSPIYEEPIIKPIEPSLDELFEADNRTLVAAA